MNTNEDYLYSEEAGKYVHLIRKLFHLYTLFDMN